MKILTFTTLFPSSSQPNFGIFIYQRMAAVMQYFDVDVKVVAPVPYFPPLQKFKRWYHYSQVPDFENIEPFDVWHPRYVVTPKIGMSMYGFSMFLSTYHLIKRLHKNYHFDLIDAHYIYPDGFAAVLLGKVLRIPVVLSARGTDINHYPHLPIIRNLIIYTIDKADATISVCESLKSTMLELSHCKKEVYVVANGIDQDRFHKLEKFCVRKRVGIDIDDKILLTVGALIKRKGIHILIEAINRLKKDGILNFRTIIIGKGEEKATLSQQIQEASLEENIKIIGEVMNEELVFWYNSADIFFLGSSREGWPNVVCEALACGTPVVATGVNGIPEIIDSDEVGLIVERTPESFAEGIVKAFNKNWDYEKIHSYGQSRNWNQVAAEVSEIFSSIKLPD